MATQAASAAGFQPGREIRFAVVMYGGVSLAIYMNGVSLELLNMVRSTADSMGRDLKGTELIYRALAATLEPNPRFVVDVISGTSAGGINGIFLAKALCINGEIAPLKRLWIEEGEIAKLLCDDEYPASLPAKDPPRSLLNTRRMYEQLFLAFEGMDKDVSAKARPLVKEMDLFVTTTDLNGQSIELRLYDSVANEKKYRHRFHFALTHPESSGLLRNDFGHDFNPFLAFAARCTSAFPFAFEPMNTDEASGVLAALGLKKAWEDSLQDHLVAPYGKDELKHRVFGDGGYLDNAPFSYAIEGLAERHYSMPVDRKLLYVEPDPERLKNTGLKQFNFIENTLACLVTLPRHETIREDIEAIKRRNHIVERLGRITGFIDEAIGSESPENAGLQPNATGKQMSNYLGLKTRVLAQKRGGAAYWSYHNVKLSAVTDDLAQLTSNILGLSDDADTFLALRKAIKMWRERNYNRPDVTVSDDLRETSVIGGNESVFLLQFDINYRLRRIEFLLHNLDNAICNEPRGKELFKTAEPESLRKLRGEINEIHAALRCICGQLWRSTEETHYASYVIPGVAQQIEAARQRILNAFTNLEFGLGGKTSGTRDELASGIRRWIRLPEIEADEEIRTFLDANKGANLEKISDAFSGLLQPLKICFTWASNEMDALFNSDDPVNAKAKTIYRFYESYDAAIFPVLYATGAKNTSITEIIRISPLDTLSSRPGYMQEIRDGKDVDALPEGQNKLGGITLAHFSAFLQKEWRENDILWGRLNAVERLLTTCDRNALRLTTTPIGDLKRQNQYPPSFQILEKLGFKDLDSLSLLDAAHITIIKEELQPQLRQSLFELIGRALISLSTAEDKLQALRQMITDRPNTTLEAQVQIILQECLHDEKDLLLFLREKYACDVRPDPKRGLRALARAVRIVGGMIEGLQKDERFELPGYKGLLWFTKILWGLVEISVPRTIAEAIGRYWLSLLYIIGGILIVGGVLFENAIWRTGLVISAITIALDLGRASLKRIIEGKRVSPKKRFAFDITVAAFAVVGALAACYWSSGLSKAMNAAAAWFKPHRVPIAVAAVVLLAVISLVWDARRQYKKSRQKDSPGKK